MLQASVDEAVVNQAPPMVADKWVLSSALQKSIRRGLPAQSTAISIRLHQVDPTYLRKRLPIIALEDIGLGDVAVCQQVVEACASAKCWRDAQTTITIATLVSAMAGAVKSRGACDAFCLTEVHAERATLLPHALRLGESDLIQTACDVDRPQIDRLYALRVLGGLKDEGYRTLSLAKPAALDEVGARLNLPPPVRWLVSHQNKTAGLAAMLPLVFDLAKDNVVREGHEFPRAMDMVGGLPLCALDQYTRLGKTGLKRYYSTSKALKEFTNVHIRGAAPQALVNMAMFQTESCVLDRFVSSAGLNSLRQEVDQAELVSLGLMNAADRGDLVQLLRGGADDLASIRVELLAELFPATDQVVSTT